MNISRAVDPGRDRVECIVIGPNGSQDQSLSPDSSFFNKIVSVLRTNNFTIPQTEIRSGTACHTYLSSNAMCNYAI